MIGPVVSAGKILIEIALCVYVVVLRISLNTSGYTGPIFATFSPYESALRADDGNQILCRSGLVYLELKYLRICWTDFHSLCIVW